MESKENNYFEEDGKTFWDNGNGTFGRSHDENFDGPRFTYKRCPFCDKLVCQSHSWHWLRHLDKCAPDFYNNGQLLELRYKKISEVNYVNKKHSRSKQNF